MDDRHPHRRVVRRLLVGAVALATLLVAAGPAAAGTGHGPGYRHRHHGGPPVTVMTRNLYLGGDIGRPLAAVAALPADATDQQKLFAFANANDTLRGIVDRTDFPARARLLAGEMARTRPDLVGLQEVALWRHGPLELDQVGVPNATVVDYDFLAILLRDLRRAHAPYEAVVVQQESDVEGPAFHQDGANPFGAARDVRLTMRDVILRRVHSPVRVQDTGGGNYTARLTVDLAGAPFSFVRGYTWADVRAGHRSFRFVNTHLESEFSGIALAQANELVHGAAQAPGRPVVLVCDCNSDPESTATKPGDPTPHNAPYQLIVGSGFTDEWLQHAPADQGYTSGLSETVDDPDLSGIDHRIDMVFAHGARGGPLEVRGGTITGDSARTCSGLWASDHLGVVLRLRL